MAKPWKDGDSARTMTKKYNETAIEVGQLKDEVERVVTPIPQQLEHLQEQIDQKVSDVTAEDLGLGNVDNTADIDKPVSTAQSIAIKLAVKDTLTSQPATTIEGDPANGSIIVFGDLIVQGSDNVKKQLIFNADGTCSWVRVN